MNKTIVDVNIKKKKVYCAISAISCLLPTRAHFVHARLRLSALHYALAIRTTLLIKLKLNKNKKLNRRISSYSR